MNLERQTGLCLLMALLKVRNKSILHELLMDIRLYSFERIVFHAHLLLFTDNPFILEVSTNFLQY